MRLTNFKDVDINNIQYSNPKIIDENTYLSKT